MNLPRITDRAKLVQALQLVPYAPGGGDWSGADCWGVMELYLWNLQGIRLDDRMEHPPGPQGLEEAFEQRGTGWMDVANMEPRDGDVWFFREAVPVMNAEGKVTGRSIVEHGHCGVFTNGMILHAVGEQLRFEGELHWTGGVRLEPADDRRLAGRVSAKLRRVELA